MSRRATPEQPGWVCRPCGIRFARRQPHPDQVSTWHNGVCCVCGKPAAVTEPRDFGYLLAAWRTHGKEGQ